MITKSFIDEQIAKSKNEKRTSSFIRKFVFKTVDMALREHYGKNYSDKCLQSSAGIKELLSFFKIKSELFTGSLCVLEVFEKDNSIGYGWGGFYGNEYHIFAGSEYYDLIDLTISQLHLHPNSRLKGEYQIPAFWWTPIDEWPSIIIYLSDGPIKIELPEDDMKDYSSYIEKVNEVKERLINSSTIEEIDFSPIIFGKDSLEYLTKMGEPWLVMCSKVAKMNIKFPDVVIKKEQELIKRYNSLNRT